MLTLKESMHLAGQNLIASLSVENGYSPIWNTTISRDMKAVSKFYWPSCNIASWWDAMLRLEAAIGFVIPAKVEAGMMRLLGCCFDNPLNIGAVINAVAPPGQPDPESVLIDRITMREFLLTLACLVRYRKSWWAVNTGKKMIRALDRFIQDDGLFDWKSMAEVIRKAGKPVPESEMRNKEEGARTVLSHGRSIEPLVEFYLETGDEAALQLADRLARYHFDVSTREDGSAPDVPNHGLHTHSWMCLLRGFLVFGEVTRQWRYIDRAVKSFQNGVLGMIKESGFISHDWGAEINGETTAPGNVVQLGLWLSRYGHTEYLDVAERLLRSRILASQTTKMPDLAPPVTLKEKEGVKAAPSVALLDHYLGRFSDEGRNLNARVYGAFGGLLCTHPHGETVPTTDITCSDVHTLCDVYQNIVERTEAGLRINFHIDYSDDDIEITTESGGRRTVRVLLHGPDNLFVRVPRWTPAESVVLRVNGSEASVKKIGDFAYVPCRTAGVALELSYDLPERRVVETTNGVDYEFLWRGDEVAGIKPNTDFFPFYPNML
ncbi:MAG: hypothetical protein V2A58_10175 [Planctomycetota bacterium]